ncbi:MAG: hypothetical protein EOP88_01470 [Verrucomicrobiaceae bacterium]|nr:MAG: hypothetical protein EOP88_01470 [Verrucomicrobiaceae bacterium]
MRETPRRFCRISAPASTLPAFSIWMATTPVDTPARGTRNAPPSRSLRPSSPTPASLSASSWTMPACSAAIPPTPTCRKSARFSNAMPRTDRCGSRTTRSSFPEMQDPATTPESPGTETRFAALDGVRGLAVIMVLVWHYLTCQISNDAGWFAPAIRRLFSTTASGVDLFFALSGFLIAGILLDQKGKAGYFKTFYLRRTCRIFPLYFLIFGLFLVLSGTSLSQGPGGEWLFAGAMPHWSYATFTQNIFMGIRETFGANWLGVTWSLAVEEQFYLILPLAVALLSRKPLAVTIVALFLLMPLLRWVSPGFHNYACLPWRGDSLLAGVLAALLVRSDRMRTACLENQLRLHLSASILFCGQILLLASPGYAGVFGETLEALFFASLILILRLGTCRPLQGIFENRLLTWFGTLSYGIYMFHQPLSGLAHGFLRGQAPRIAGLADAGVTISTAGVTLLLAWLSFRFFETPFLRFAHRFSYTRRETPCRSN